MQLNKVNKSILLWMFTTIFSILLMVESQAIEGVVYNDNGKRDPMMQLVSELKRPISGLSGVQTIDEIQLEGFVIDTESTSMIIANGVVLYEGDKVEHVEVKKITEIGVTFIINEEEYFKSFREDQ